MTKRTQEAHGAGDGASGRRKGGRPTKYTPELGDRICAWIADGNSARSACVEFGFAMSTLFKWLRDRPQFSEQYARACEARADTLAEEIIEIADDSSRDWSKDDEGNDVFNHEHVQRDRLRVDARKWAAARMNPRKWGDRQQVEHSGHLGVTHEQALEELE